VKLIERYASDQVSAITPFVNLGKNAKYKTNTFQASIQAMNADGFDILNFTLDKGSFFYKNDVRTESKVAILGPEVVDALFGSTNPIDKTIKIDDTTFKVIGTFEKKGQGFDNALVMPYTTAMSVFNVKNISNISMKVRDPKQIDITIIQIQKALLRDLKPDEFTILSQEDVLSSIQSILGMLTTGLGAIAGISLLVGGIGIMNIMLVSVTERTREIGLRKAIGATPSDIGIQFLFESTLLSVGGGIIGIAIGWGASLIARNYIRTEVPWWAIALAFSFSALVGIMFGTYPAAQASRKDPIEALRYE
jgi:putative ABC transport system permease protein